ncbi:carcinoembryonic antigen-related cell adhesion molecule 1 isoform X3 [Echinops telfairi]|uniref:Carcinoembryonic antigen-related cell adhesion molecule 1 isoform X3 n=1 Tax=Echinops telfairi TaxID=9371 RepID=A0AC55D8Y2_ECHTE|nr:carcinoembryonic antigen-related cell adhesion molecule 1 isoform X3 [Echinops telfairi]
MEAPSVTPSKGHSSWQGALLTVSLLLSWSPPTAAQLTIESVPRAAAEGQDVLLRNPSQAEAAFYNWYKGNSVLIQNNRIGTYAVSSGIFTRGPAYTGRETIYPNGSLLLQNVTLADTGTYLLQRTKADGVPEALTGQILVFQALTKPSIQASNTTVSEHTGPVVFTCLTKHNGISISWFHDGERLRLTERMKLSQDNSSLTINPVRMEDAGKYQCEVSNPGNAQKSDSLTLTVEANASNSGLSAGAIAGIVIGVLACVSLVAALVYCLWVRKTAGAGDQHDLTEQKPSAANHNQEYSLPNMANEVAYTAVSFSTPQQPKTPTSDSPAPVATETIYTEVKKK